MKLISCLMPSMRSPEIVERAIRSFQAQTYPAKELVILRPLSDSPRLVKRLSGILDHLYAKQATCMRKLCVPDGLSIGELRNAAARETRGSVLAHWDDDDVSHPDRLARSMERIDAGADLVGTSRVTYVDPATGKRYLFDGSAFAPTLLLGGTMMFRRKVWEKYGFDDVEMGEDVRFFSRVNGNGHHVDDLRDETMLIATISPDATSPKDVTGPGWKELP